MFADKTILYKLPHLIPIMPVYFVIFTVAYSFHNYYTFDGGSHTYIKFITVPLFYICAMMVIVCHLLAMFSCPGNTNKSNIVSTNEQSHLYCNKCQNFRPERAHHCKTCNKCALKMDHHCPWIANCVGLYNQKYFYQFLFYATLGDLIGFICLFNKVIEIEFKLQIANPSLSLLLYENKDNFLLILGASLALGMTVAIGFLFTMQTRGLLLNMTPIEFKKYQDLYSCPWYNENYHTNFQLVLGDKVYKWFIPIKKVESDDYLIKLNDINKKDQHSTQGSYLSLGDDYDDININLNLND